MNFSRFKNWLNGQIPVSRRLRNVYFWYLFFLMVCARKHSTRGAAEFSGMNKSQFSRFLKYHAGLAVCSLEHLSKKQAKQFSGAIDCLAHGAVPWKIGVLVDSTIQNRSSLHPDNVK